jgi:nitrate reductase NapAB chaperone NapD
MPIGGFVIHLDPATQAAVLPQLAALPQVEIHGHNDQGQVVAVLDTDSAEAMEQLSKQIGAVEGVLSLGLTYFHAEDEVAQMARGEIRPRIGFGRKHEKPANRS